MQANLNNSSADNAVASHDLEELSQELSLGLVA
jgi:hypothetical protein